MFKELDNQVTVLKDCEYFLNTYSPRWEAGAVDPRVGIRTGVLNCAGRTAVAGSFVQLAGMDAYFAYRTTHGSKNSAGAPQWGHAAMLLDRVMSSVTLGIDSFRDGKSAAFGFNAERLEGYQVRPLVQGFEEYCARVEVDVSLAGLDEAIAQLVANDQLPSPEAPLEVG